MPRQDSLHEQLKDVQVQAVAMGAYDAADFLTRKIQEIEQRLSTGGPRASARRGLDVLEKGQWEGVTVLLTQRIKDGAELLFIDSQERVSIGWNGKVLWGQEASFSAVNGERLLVGSSFSVKAALVMRSGQRHVEVSGEAPKGLSIYLNSEMVYQQLAVVAEPVALVAPEM